MVAFIPYVLSKQTTSLLHRGAISFKKQRNLFLKLLSTFLSCLSDHKIGPWWCGSQLLMRGMMPSELTPELVTAHTLGDKLQKRHLSIICTVQGKRKEESEAGTPAVPTAEWCCKPSSSKPHTRGYEVWCVCVCAQLCLTLCDPEDCSLPGSSVPGISQSRILERVTISSSRGSSWPSDQTGISCSDRWVFCRCTTWEIQEVETHTEYELWSECDSYWNRVWCKGYGIMEEKVTDSFLVGMRAGDSWLAHWRIE